MQLSENPAKREVVLNAIMFRNLDGEPPDGRLPHGVLKCRAEDRARGGVDREAHLTCLRPDLLKTHNGVPDGLHLELDLQSHGSRFAEPEVRRSLRRAREAGEGFGTQQHAVAQAEHGLVDDRRLAATESVADAAGAVVMLGGTLGRDIEMSRDDSSEDLHQAQIALVQRDVRITI